MGQDDFSFCFFYIPFFQLQTAVAEMEKALGTPSHVMIYKQYWDYYFKAPALLEKLKLEQSIMVAQDTSRREGSVSVHIQAVDYYSCCLLYLLAEANTEAIHPGADHK